MSSFLMFALHQILFAGTRLIDVIHGGGGGGDEKRIPHLCWKTRREGIWAYNFKMAIKKM
jgi:hypothetical protein